MTVGMCQALRRMVGNYGNTAPAGTMDALQRRKLAVADAVNGGVAWRLTSRGVQVALLLGANGHGHDAAHEICDACGKPYHPDLMAWGAKGDSLKCIECAVKGMA